MSNYKDYGFTNKAPSHISNYVTKKINKLISIENNKCIIDVGCGNGWLTKELNDKGFKIYGIDASQSGIDIGNKRLEGHFFLQDITSSKLPLEIESEPFDTVISTEVIEHLYNPKKYIKFCKEILNKNGGGELIISTPYHGYFKNLILAITGKLDNHFTVNWEGGHIKFFSRKTLSNLLRSEGFEVTDFRGCGRLPYLWKSMVIKAKI